MAEQTLPPQPQRPPPPHYSSVPPAAAPKPKKPRRMIQLRWGLMAGLFTAALFFMLGIGAGGGTPTERVVMSPSPVVSVVTKTVQAAAPTTPAPPPPPAVPTIADGSWTVGTDFPPGTYRTEGAGSNCYWGIYKSGSNEADIIQNHIGAGNLTVTLQQGQDFTSRRCGVWKKTG